MASPRIICWGAATRGADVMRAAGRRPPGLCSRRGACSAGMHPPFLFCRAKRETGRARSKEKSVGALRCSGPPRDGGRRIGASADLALPSGTLGSSARSVLPSRGRRYRGSRGARTHLICSSFRAFRFATRCPGGRGGLYHRRIDSLPRSRRGRCPHRPVAEAASTTGPAAAKSGAGCIPDFPGPKVSPRARRFRL